MFNRHTFTGALEDTRSPEEKQKDYVIEEVVAAYAPVNLQPITVDRMKVYPRRNQAQSSTCVAQTVAKMGGVLRDEQYSEFIEYSATPTYQNRKNKPSLGMWGVDAMQLWKDKGITLETLVPSQNLSEAQIEAQPVNEYDKQVAGISKIDAYIQLPRGNFDLLLSTLQTTKKPIMVWFKGEYNEWSRDIPTIIYADRHIDRDYFTVHHSVTATPNIGIYDGKEGFTIEDSWGSAGINGLGIRWITREFYEARNTYAAYVTSFKSYEDIGVVPAKPQHRFTGNLEYGMQANPDVIALQDILKYEGLFPANQSSTGNYYEITRKAVLAWQIKHGVPTDGLEGRLVGVKTKKELNRLYG